MLGKLCKHEFKALSRYFLPIYIFMIILTPIFSLSIRFMDTTSENPNTIAIVLGTLSIVGFVVMIIALVISSYIMIILRFYRTTATSEAYLTFTLPVTPNQILLSKWLMAVVWQIFSLIMAVVFLFGMLFISGVTSPGTILNGFREFLDILINHPELNGGLTRIDVILTLVMMIVGVLTAALQFYCSIMLGQLFNEHRVLASIGMYVAIYIVVQVLSTMVILPVAYKNGTAAIEAGTTYNSATPTLLISIVLNVVLGIVFYIVTSLIMKKRLNVR